MHKIGDVVRIKIVDKHRKRTYFQILNEETVYSELFLDPPDIGEGLML
jgi:hypothetical protein